MFTQPTFTREIKQLAEKTGVSEQAIKKDILMNEDSVLLGAIIFGCHNLMRHIISRKPAYWKPDNFKDGSYKTLLMHAVGNGNTEAATLLIEHGANTTYKTGWHLGVESVSEALEVLKNQAGEDSEVYKEMKAVIYPSIFNTCFKTCSIL